MRGGKCGTARRVYFLTQSVILKNATMAQTLYIKGKDGQGVCFSLTILFLQNLRFLAHCLDHHLPTGPGPWASGVTKD